MREAQADPSADYSFPQMFCHIFPQALARHGRFRLQATAVKQARRASEPCGKARLSAKRSVFYLVEGLVFNLLDRQHL